MIISNKIKFLLEKQRPVGVEIITLRKMLKRTVNWSWINLAGNTNKCMLPNGERGGSSTVPVRLRCVEGYWQQGWQNKWNISGGFARLNRGQSVPWPSALGFPLMLSEEHSAVPGLLLWLAGTAPQLCHLPEPGDRPSWNWGHGNLQEFQLEFGAFNRTVSINCCQLGKV